jgi:hypothetical protein
MPASQAGRRRFESGRPLFRSVIFDKFESVDGLVPPRTLRDYTAGGVQRRNGVSFSYAPGDGWAISSMTVPHGVFA